LIFSQIDLSKKVIDLHSLKDNEKRTKEKPYDTLNKSPIKLASSP
jgi:hypothetical protein